jgi:PAS domain S-box-containing protein
MRGTHHLHLLLISLLAAAAVALNLHAPTVFFDSQMMVGGSLGVFALLEFGWPGLVVGIAALAVTVVRWGHPIELIVGLGFLVWLQVFLTRFNGGPANRGNGRVLLAALAYWLAVGFCLEMVLFWLVFGLGGVPLVCLGLKETVSSLGNAAIGFLLFTALQAARARSGFEAVRRREFAVGLALAATIIPSMAMVIILSGEVTRATLHARLAAMRAYGVQAVNATLRGARLVPAKLAVDGKGLAFSVQGADGTLTTSDPDLFARLAHDYVEESPCRTGIAELGIKRSARDAAVIAANATSYLFTTFSVPAETADGDSSLVTVVEPLDGLLNTLDGGLLLPSFVAILGFLGLGAVVSNVVNTMIDDRERLRNAENRLGGQRDRLEQLLGESDRRWRNFFDLPMVGTAITSRSQGWLAVNDETCRMLGYTREELFRKTWAEITYPDDLAADVEQFARMLRRDIDGYTLEKRFVRKDGRIVHTILSGGCGAIGDVTPEVFYVTLLDVTDRKAIEAELVAAREREERAEEEMRQTLEKKLKTSLSAAAIAHEINQPLSRVLLRARMGLEAARGTERDMLSALVADAERVVAVIQKMKVLLRNVETVQQEVDLGVITASALHQVKRVLRDAGVSVVRAGPEGGCLLLGDEVQLQMIVINLLTNAVEAIISAGSDRREVVVEQSVQDGIVELVVGDSGPGWPGGTLDEMLLNTTKPEGAGVGLYVVKTAVDNHRGQITVGRSPLGGAEFRIRFPRSAGNAQRRSGTGGGRQRDAAINS